MNKSTLPNDGYSQAKSGMRTLGPALTVIGAILTLIGIGSFFIAMGSSNTFSPLHPSQSFSDFQNQADSLFQQHRQGQPKLFFLAFVGLPTLGVGITITKAGYLKEITQYAAKETSPAISTVVSTVRSAINDGETPCPHCALPIEPGSKFCSHCGNALADLQCPQCNALVEPDDKFCPSCGSPTKPS